MSKLTVDIKLNAVKRDLNGFEGCKVLAISISSTNSQVIT